jgi:hypothetical protein
MLLTNAAPTVGTLDPRLAHDAELKEINEKVKVLTENVLTKQTTTDEGLAKVAQVKEINRRAKVLIGQVNIMTEPYWMEAQRSTKEQIAIHFFNTYVPGATCENGEPSARYTFEKARVLEKEDEDYTKLQVIHTMSVEDLQRVLLPRYARRKVSYKHGGVVIVYEHVYLGLLSHSERIFVSVDGKVMRDYPYGE